MSYLSPLRLHFSGSFQAGVSTVNNDPRHFNNATFKPSYQEMLSGSSPDQLNGWFNPRGSGDWRLSDCTVTSVFMTDGSRASDTDSACTAVVADSDRGAPAKLVDLDPEQQLVSMIWGLEVRIVAEDGHTLLRGQFEPAAFIDIWDRSCGPGAGGDMGAGAMYQSVLGNLDWGNIEGSPFLRELKSRAKSGLLSIKFNVDRVNMDFHSPRFMMGRIVGTIGPVTSDEPRHFVLGRQFMTTSAPGGGGNFFAPSGGVNFCTAVVDDTAGKVYLDLGNALPTTGPDGSLFNLGDLTLCQIPPPEPIRQTLIVGTLPAVTYADVGWYERTAGVVVFPADHIQLSSDELARLKDNPLALTVTQPDGTQRVVIAEPSTGEFVRADQFVFRLNPGDEKKVDVYATRFGQPHTGRTVINIPVPEQLQPSSSLGHAPDVASPASAFGYDSQVTIGLKGKAELTICAGDPRNPRGYIDGQVYALYPALAETIISPASPYPFNQWNFVSVLVWNAFESEKPPTWFGTVQPIFQQYANLYPVMRRFLDLGDYDSVCANIGLLTLAFRLDQTDPNYMPVSRDLSKAKRDAILRWLEDLGDDGKPLKGNARQISTTTEPATPAPEPRHPPPHEIPLHQGGKASAASRRPIARRPPTVDRLTGLTRGTQT